MLAVVEHDFGGHSNPKFADRPKAITINGLEGQISVNGRRQGRENVFACVIRNVSSDVGYSRTIKYPLCAKLCWDVPIVKVEKATDEF
jgi:hypothetical protein